MLKLSLPAESLPNTVAQAEVVTARLAIRRVEGQAISSLALLKLHPVSNPDPCAGLERSSNRPSGAGRSWFSFDEVPDYFNEVVDVERLADVAIHSG